VNATLFVVYTLECSGP